MPPPDLRIIEIVLQRSEPELRLALRDLEDAQFQVQAVALEEAEGGEFPAKTLLWGAFREKNLTGSMLAQLQPGGTAMLWPPRLGDRELEATAAQIVGSAVCSLSQHNVKLVQALLPTDAGADADLLRANGFVHFSDLLYLVCLKDDFAAVPLASSLEFRAVEHFDETGFAELIEATYEGTLDCPAVNGMRSVDEVLLGYRATGKFVPHWWLAVRHRGENVGCLIIADYPQHDLCELIYMGLVPVARQKGFGLEVVRHAMRLAGDAQRQRLVLAVDAANEPALRMYAAAGFQAWDRKSVFIRVMSSQIDIAPNAAEKRILEK